MGTAHLAELRDGLATLYELDDAYGGSEVRSLAVRHLRRVRRIIAEATYPDVIGRQLHLLAGESAEQCGWIHFDSGDHEAARRYWGDAMTVATALGDENLEILVLSALSLQANHVGRPRDGLLLARAAQDRAARQGSPALQSLIAAREARALTLLGDTSGASRLLARSMRLLEKRGTAAPSWAAFHGQAELDYAQGLYYVDTGRPAAGVSFLRAALAHQTRIYSRNLTLYRLRLAGALAGAGELDEAADEAVRAVEHLDEVESGRVRRLAENVRTQLAGTSSVQAAAAAEEMDDRMRSRGDDF
ncbi:hypothetical protein [Streptomyces sp. CA-253872]|uniref:hypothetical protein n=1 Tax=Streptomyces sp. CA-253872 TaxID=3240067 RepID=UPI003D91F763